MDSSLLTGKFFWSICLGLSLSPLWAQPVASPDPAFWIPNGPINAILVTNDTVYLGGDFSYLGPRTGPAALFDNAAGVLLGAPPRIGGIVKAVAPDNSGGWFIGGTFTNIGSRAITNLAHLTPDLLLDPGWDAQLGNSTAVNALVLSNGVLYVGGSFQKINGQSISGLAGLSPTNASAIWMPQLSGSVNAMRLAGNLLYVGGQFFSVGFSNAQNLAAIATDTALATGWNPTADQSVFALEVSGNTVYVGGQFTMVGTKPRNRLAALDATTGVATPWLPNPNGIVRALATDGTSVYVAGDFTTLGGKSRTGFGALNTGNGAATALDLQIQAPGGATLNFVRSILLQGTALWVGGGFTNALGALNPLVVGVDLTSNSSLPVPLATDFNGNVGASYGPYAMATFNGTIFVGGDFQSFGGVTRQEAAALSLSTGAILPWAPTFSGPVLSLAYGANRVYVGGSFTNANVTNSVHGLVAVDPLSGASLPFSFSGTNQFSDTSITTLIAGPSALYVGGNFGYVGSQTRHFLAAVTSDTGALIPGFDAKLGGGYSGITAMTLSGTTLYVAGDYSTVNNQAIARLAALSTTDGSALNWTPNPNYTVLTLAVTSDSLYVGGQFTQIGGVAFNGFAGFSLADFSSLGVDASANAGGNLSALAATPTTLYAGGTFSSIGGEFRQNLACLASFNAASYDWNPSPDQPPTAIVLTDDLAFVGGPFRNFGVYPSYQVSGFFAVFQRAPQFLSSSLTASSIHIVTTTGDRTDAVLQSSSDIGSGIWTNVATNELPGFTWTMDFPKGAGNQFFRAVAR